MQRLRAILNAALSKQALYVRMSAGEYPQFFLQGHVIEKDPDGPISEADLQQILSFVMPGQVFAEKAQLTAALNVGPQGILKLRAFQSPLRLDIFTPAGASLFDQVLDVVPVTQPVTNPPLVTPPVPMPPPIAVAPAPIPAVAPITPAPVLVTAPVTVPFTVPFTVPETVTVSAQAPVAPAPTIVAAPISLAQPAVPAPPSAGAPDPSKSSADAGSEFGLMFRAGSAPKKNNAPVAAHPVTETPGQFQHIQVPQILHAPSTSHQSHEQIPEEINFGSREAAEGSISQGSNPIDKLLREMVEMKASDMHLTVGQPIIFRVHGDIKRMSQEPILPDMMQQFLLPTMPKRNHQEFSKSQDTDYAYELAGIGRFRVNIFRDRNGVGAVMRHIPSQILTAEQLNLAPAITKLCALNKGLVLVTGPTGSGKSTTLAAMIDLINRTRKEHILTIEDPIEFVHPQQMCLVNQREVHKHTGSFARALKAALREDPDIVLIGEMRDLETIAIAIETAETGHLVFGTLHTTTAMSTVDRIIDQFPSDRQAQIRVMLSSSLRGVVAQTLLKKKTGGRVAAHEILIANDAVGAMIREGKVQHLANHMLTQKQDGNQLLNDSLLKLVQDGVVEAQDAFFKAVDKNSFMAAAKARGINISAA